MGLGVRVRVRVRVGVRGRVGVSSLQLAHHLRREEPSWLGVITR